MRRLLLLSSFAGFALVCAMTAAPAGAGASEVVARVAGAEFTVDELRSYLDALPQAEREALERDPGLLSKAVRNYLAQQTVLKEAKSRKFDHQPEVKAALDRQHDLALEDLYLHEVAQIPKDFPSESELQNAYEANKSTFVAPRQYRLAQIFIFAPKGDKAAENKARDKLDDIVKRLKARGADFSAIARATDESAKGDEIGWVAEPQLLPSIRETVTGLAKDGVSDPIRLDDGWHIVKLLDTKPAGIQPFEDVKETLARQMRAQRFEAAKQAYITKLMESNPPAINELALSKILDKTSK